MKEQFVISAFADEYSPSIDLQIEILKKLDIHYLEIRNVDGKNIAKISLEKAHEIKEKLDKNNIKVSSIGSPLGKIDISDDFEEHLKVAKHVFEIAKILDTKNIRMFSFYNKTNIPFVDFETKVFNHLDKLLKLSKEYGLTLCLENEAKIYGETDDDCLKILQHFNGEYKAVFDMGNFVLDNVEPIEAYQKIKPYIEYIHIKDSFYDGKIVPAGKGQAKIKDILSLIHKDLKNTIFVTIEPHLMEFEGLNQLKGSDFTNPYSFKDEKEAFVCGAINTIEIVKSIEDLRTFSKNHLLVKIGNSRKEMGFLAYQDIKNTINSLLAFKEEINIIFAAAPSQNEVLEYLKNDKDIPWNRINAYHMDEYIGLSKSAPQRFGNFLNEHLFNHVPFKTINYIKTDIGAEEIIKEYSGLIKNNRPDIVVLGIGENGHIAFNDPPVADFNDKALIKVVELDEICRNQQVNDGCFKNITDVPTHAATLTIPALFNSDFMFCVVPASSKANAVYKTINGEISTSCPASILRKHKNATLYLDLESSALLKC